MNMPRRDVASRESSEAAALQVRYRYLGGAAPEDFAEPRNFVCITLYNEPAAIFTATLSALLVSLREFARGGRQPDEARSAVFIVADGADRIDSEVRPLLIRLGLIPPDGDPDTETVFYHSLHAPSALLAGDQASPDCLPLERQVRFIVCIKPANRGKLDSHALFFGDLCHALNPVYCHQLDVGTLIAPGAVRALVDQMDSSPTVAALASQVSVPLPGPADELIRTWQYLDFSTQLALGWPGEVTAGHLSVLPGQYCLIRWSALRGAGEGRAPLDRYLRGAGACSSLERLMFLAEDRVLGNELVLASGMRWTLDYCPRAHATTDACASMAELLRQRRRWNNGSSACRLWMLGRWRAQFGRTDRTVFGKLRFSLAMLWQTMTLVQQLLVPALTLSTWAALLGALARVDLRLAALTGLVAVLSWVLVLKRARSGLHVVARDGATLASFALVGVVLTQAFGWGAALLVTAPTIVAAVMTAIVAGPQGGTVLRRSAEYSAINPFMQVVLAGYALARLDDLSWGTKELTAAVGAANDRRTMRRLRNALFAGWIGLNAAVAWIAWSTDGLLFAGLNPVLEASSVLMLAVTIPASFVFFARRRLSRQIDSPGYATDPAARFTECEA